MQDYTKAVKEFVEEHPTGVTAVLVTGKLGSVCKFVCGFPDNEKISKHGTLKLKFTSVKRL